MVAHKSGPQHGLPLGGPPSASCSAVHWTVPRGGHISCTPNVTYGCATSSEGTAQLWLESGCRGQFLVGNEWHFDCSRPAATKRSWCQSGGLEQGAAHAIPVGSRGIVVLPAHGWGDRLLALLAIATWRRLVRIGSGLPPLDLDVHWAASADHRCCWGCVAGSCNLKLLQPHFTLLDSTGLHLQAAGPTHATARRVPLSATEPSVVLIKFPVPLQHIHPPFLAALVARPVEEVENVYLATARSLLGPSPEILALLSTLPPPRSYVAVHLRRGDKVVPVEGGLDKSHRVRPGELGRLDNKTWQLIPRSGPVLLVGDEPDIVDRFAALLGGRAIFPPRVPSSRPRRNLNRKERMSIAEANAQGLSDSEAFYLWKLGNRSEPHPQMQMLVDFFSISRARTVVVSQRFSSFSTSAALAGGATVVYAMGASKIAGTIARWVQNRTAGGGLGRV